MCIRDRRNPIEMIKSRVKKPKSIVEKLQRRGFEISLESMEKNLDATPDITSTPEFWAATHMGSALNRVENMPPRASPRTEAFKVSLVGRPSSVAVTTPDRVFPSSGRFHSGLGLFR